MLIGVAQEKASAWRGWRDGGPDGHPHFCFGRQTVFVNHYCFYILDPDWGPAFVQTCAYAPFPVWLYLNGHEWAKRQAARRGLGFEALDDGFRCCENADALQAICAALSAHHVEAFCAAGSAAAVAVHGRRSPPRLWLRARLPPARAVRHAGVRSPAGGARVV